MNKFFSKFFNCAKCLHRDTKECPLAVFVFHPVTNTLLGYTSKVEDNFFCKNFKKENNNKFGGV